MSLELSELQNLFKRETSFQILNQNGRSFKKKELSIDINLTIQYLRYINILFLRKINKKEKIIIFLY